MKKKFIGYFIIGAATKEEAQKGKGLKAWSTKRPNAIVRFFNKVLLNIRWVDEIKEYERKHSEASPRSSKRSTSRRPRD
jgi:hypothetical protein